MQVNVTQKLKETQCLLQPYNFKHIEASKNAIGGCPPQLYRRRPYTLLSYRHALEYKRLGFSLSSL